jgi:guanylate kinase
MKNTDKGRLYVISAPSGTGKGTIIAKMLELRPELKLSVSATTRAPREGEAHGVNYYFVTRAEFEDMIARGEFHEYAEYVGEYYGTPKKPIHEHMGNGKDVLLEIETQGAMQVMMMNPDAVSIFIVPPSLEELERRLRGRGTDSEDKLLHRLERARLELDYQGEYNHVVVNDDVTRAAEEILSIIDAG